MFVGLPYRLFFCRACAVCMVMFDWPRYVLFFDGDCAVCSSTVKRVARADRRGEIFFAPLRGEWAKRAADEGLIDLGVDSIWWVEDGQRSAARLAAARAIARTVGGVWHILRVSALLPLPVQKWLYDSVAKRRYKWFGKVESCDVGEPSWRDRVLD